MQLTPEQIAAAERLRTVKAGTPWHKVYEGTGDPWGRWQDDSRLLADLALALLAERDQKVTEQNKKLRAVVIRLYEWQRSCQEFMPDGLADEIADALGVPLTEKGK